MNQYIKRNLPALNFFDMTIRSTKTGNRTENQTPDREKFMCKSTSMSKEICLHKKIFDTTIRSTKSETGQKTGPRTNRKFLWMNRYENTNLHALEFFR